MLPRLSAARCIALHACLLRARLPHTYVCCGLDCYTRTSAAGGIATHARLLRAALLHTCCMWGARVLPGSSYVRHAACWRTCLRGASRITLLKGLLGLLSVCRVSPLVVRRPAPGAAWGCCRLYTYVGLPCPVVRCALLQQHCHGAAMGCWLPPSDRAVNMWLLATGVARTRW